MTNRPFLSCLKPLFQIEAKCQAIDTKMIFYSLANKTHFHKKGFALSLVLNVSFWTDWKWNGQLNLSHSLPSLKFIVFLYCSPYVIIIFQSHNQQLKTEVSRYKRKFSEAQVQATKVKQETIKGTERPSPIYTLFHR